MTNTIIQYIASIIALVLIALANIIGENTYSTLMLVIASIIVAILVIKSGSRKQI